MTTGTIIGRLQRLKNAVLADGKVDWDETAQLLDTIRPLARRKGFLFQDYERLLEKCRADGKITTEESEQLAQQLDLLCRLLIRQRLKFWLAVSVVATLLASSLVVGLRIGRSLDGASLRSQETEDRVGGSR